MAFLTFFNKSLLIILLNANIEWFPLLFNGDYSDYNEKWFRINGRIIVIFMIIQIMMPFVNVTSNLMIDWVYKVWDQGKLWPKRLPKNTETKCITIS